jgi:hypothetical protein
MVNTTFDACRGTGDAADQDLSVHIMQILHDVQKHSRKQALSVVLSPG